MMSCIPNILLIFVQKQISKILLNEGEANLGLGPTFWYPSNPGMYFGPLKNDLFKFLLQVLS